MRRYTFMVTTQVRESDTPVHEDKYTFPARNMASAWRKVFDLQYRREDKAYWQDRELVSIEFWEAS